MSLYEHSHSPDAIAARLDQKPKTLYLREWVFGGIDGVVTTFAIVAAVIGANLSPLIVLTLGLANLVGDGFSMAASAYSATKADDDNYKRLREIETNHIKKYPEGEREETRQIFKGKGFEGDDLENMVEMISKDEDLWIEFMLTEEYGVSKSASVPMKAAMHTFGAFFVCGAMPLIPYVINLPFAPWLALLFAALTFFAIGSLKSRWSIKHWSREGIETTLIGLAAAGLAFLIGYGLRVITG